MSEKDKNTFSKVDYNAYKDSYDQLLINAWKTCEIKLDDDKLRALMYGYTFTDDYAKCKIEEGLLADFWEDRWEPIEIGGDSDSSDDDSDVCDENDFMTPQELQLIRVLESTGDGLTPETAISVIDVQQEYEYIQRKFPYSVLCTESQTLLDGHIDRIDFEENPFGVKSLYFDISRRCEVGYRFH